MNEDAKFREVRCLKTDRILRIPVEQIQQYFDESSITGMPRNMEPGEECLVTFNLGELWLDEVELKYEIAPSSGFRIIEVPQPLKPIFRKGDVPKFQFRMRKIARGIQGVQIDVVFYHKGMIVGYGRSMAGVNTHEVESVEPTGRDEAWEKRKEKVYRDLKARELPPQPTIRN